MGFKDKLKDGINNASDIAQTGIESTKKLHEKFKNKSIWI